MLKEKKYANGQIVHELKGDLLTYYYKNGKMKAKGPYINGLMEGEWIFYRETGQLWQTGNFKGNLKHGRFLRYDRNDKLEYDETFDEGKIVKKKNK
jgi:antitoxin component YwqK of YwqJK toxin-antitoxin module